MTAMTNLRNGDTMSGRGHNLPDATSRSRGVSAAGGGSVAAIASAAVSRIAATAVMTAMTNLRNIWSSPLIVAAFLVLRPHAMSAGPASATPAGARRGDAITP